jgi:hypothetical protein
MELTQEHTICRRKRAPDQQRCSSYEVSTHCLWTRAKAGWVRMRQLRGKYARSVDASEGRMSGDAAATREIRTTCGRERRPDEWRCGSYKGNTH